MTVRGKGDRDSYVRLYPPLNGPTHNPSCFAIASTITIFF
jgi:hypothetical protein